MISYRRVQEEIDELLCYGLVTRYGPQSVASAGGQVQLLRKYSTRHRGTILLVLSFNVATEKKGKTRYICLGFIRLYRRDSTDIHIVLVFRSYIGGFLSSKNMRETSVENDARDSLVSWRLENRARERYIYIYIYIYINRE